MFDVFYYGPKPNLFEFEKPASSLKDAAEQSRTRHYWYIYGGNDYSNFNFNFVPVPWEADHVHSFGTQWQRTGGACLANPLTVHNLEYNFHDSGVKRLADRSKWTIPKDVNDEDFDYSWHPDELEPDYEYHFPTQWQRQGGPVYRGSAGIKFMSSQKVKANSTQIFYMDFMNEQSKDQLDSLREQHPTIKSTRYVDNHLNVFKRIINLATTEYVWIVSSLCDYSEFDFSWHPDEAQRDMIHVFPSGNNRRGDTFYIRVESMRQQLYELELLDWFNVINYCDDQTVRWFSTPTVYYEHDNLIEEIKKHNFKFPYTLFTNQTNLHMNYHFCLWHSKDRVAKRVTRSGASTLVPKDAKVDLKTQMYDYPHIMDSKGEYHVMEQNLDIVYISNGEPDERKYYDHLVHCTSDELRYAFDITTSGNTMTASPRVKWVRGVNGRTAAYQEAARQSNTPWFFAVFAKLQVNPAFDFNWRPDYWQEPKHYIFNSVNPVNGLEYGHQGMIAYNKRLVLENNDPGIDFTLSQPHESVPLQSGVAHFNQSPWMTWRTAFREVLKLRLFMDSDPTLETENRLKVWTTVAHGDFGKWSLRGANDAIAYYSNVKGSYDKLMLSFDWEWLQNQYESLYKTHI
jgi:hypothetical protein